MYLDALPPDTSSYMVAGYVIFFLVTAIYLSSLLVRARNLNRDLLTLENLRDEGQTENPAPVRAAGKPKGAGKPKAARAKVGKAKRTQKKSVRNK